MASDELSTLSTAPPLDSKWLYSIEAIDPQDWERCFGVDDVLASYALQQAMEHTRFEAIEPRYLVLSHAEHIVAIVPCFTFRMSLTVVAPLWIQRAVTLLRQALPNFLYIRAFIAGTPVAICKDLIGIATMSSIARQRLLVRIAEEIIAEASRSGIGFVAIKEITSRQLPELLSVWSPRFILAESLPNTHLYLGEQNSDGFRQQLRNKYRSVMTGRLRKFEAAGFRWEISSEFGMYAEKIHALYLQVLNHSKVRFETLSPQFFVQVAKHLGERAFCALCFRGEALVAFELMLEDEKHLHPIYLGMDYAQRDAGALYYNCLYKIFEIAKARGKAVVSLGQTSYVAKASLGAVIDRLYIAVRHRNPLCHMLLRSLRRLLFPSTPTPRLQRVFRDMEAHFAGLHRHGFLFETPEVEEEKP